MVLQAWFDESGKGQEPVYLLAGYVGQKEMWEDLADEWQAELDRPPKLPYLHVKESQLFKGVNRIDRERRLLRFVEIIRNHNPRGITFLLKHSDYRNFFRVLSVHPLMRDWERSMLKNPYFVGFHLILTVMLLRQAKAKFDTGVQQILEIFLDDDSNERERLKLGFNHFLKTVKRKNPEFLDLLVNREAEFRDDKQMKPLQAADLLAWHLRRSCAEVALGNRYENPVWLSLRNGIQYDDYRYTEAQWLDVLMRVQSETWKAAARTILS